MNGRRTIKADTATAATHQKKELAAAFLPIRPQR